MSRPDKVDLLKLFSSRATEWMNETDMDLMMYGNSLSMGGVRVDPSAYAIQADGVLIWPLEAGGHVGMPRECFHEMEKHPLIREGAQTSARINHDVICTYASRPGMEHRRKQFEEFREYCLADVPRTELKLNPVPRTCLDAVGFTAR